MARYFGDMMSFSLDFCTGYAECPPYFYFCSSWPTDLESVSRDAHLVVKVSTKLSWYDHPLPNYSVIAADTLRDLVTLTFDLLTLFSGHTWRVTWSIHRPSLKILTAIRSSVMSSDMSHVRTIVARWPMMAVVFSLNKLFGGVDHVTRHVWPLTKVKRSKVKVTRSRNVSAAIKL